MPETLTEKITNAINEVERTFQRIPTPSLEPPLTELKMRLLNVDSSRLSKTNVNRLDEARRLIDSLSDLPDNDPRARAKWRTINHLLADVLADASLQDHSSAQEVKQGAATVNTTSSIDPRTVFVVHGRNMKARDAMFAFLRSIDLKPMEWATAVAQTGETNPFIGDILDAAFKKAQAFVVLLTPDETVTLDPKLAMPADTQQDKGPFGQARPNVIFEAGMAMALHRDRTVIVEHGEVRSFSDIAGRHVIHLSNTSPSRQDLADRLRAAGCPVDLSGRDWHTAGDFSSAFSAVATPQATPSSDAEPAIAKPPRKAQPEIQRKPLHIEIPDHIVVMRAGMSDMAKGLLCILATSDKGILVMAEDDESGFQLISERLVINKKPANRRETIEWKAAVDELLTLGCIESRNRNSFLITKIGYAVADRIKADKQL